MDTKSVNETALKNDHEELAQLLRRAEQGDLAVLPELRAALDADAALWRDYGDLAAHAELSLVRLAAGTNLLLGESVQRKLEEMKEELGGASPSPLEKLLITRITATWLQASYYDGLLAQRTNLPDAQAKALQRQVDAAHRRHLTALKTFATVRKLLTPAISPVQIASRLDQPAPSSRARREGIAGKVPVSNGTGV